MHLRLLPTTKAKSFESARIIHLLGDSKGEIEVRLLVVSAQSVEIERIGEVVMNDSTKGQTVGEVTREVANRHRLEIERRC